ncbi:MAG: hypothetical protein LBC67_07690 [Spirochaetales bacterium]|jgi:uncharacterized cysteine cluster protein YcgN (CxxCxxCC family)|nr:hypothetical protein [Spirochaetales bacterium]
MLKTIARIFSEYRRWKKDWDSLCGRCGLCCYERSLSSGGEVAVNMSEPCEFLDEDTRLCRVYESRFRACPDCRSVNIFRALFHRFLPSSCAYVRTFRLWRGEV